MRSNLIKVLSQQCLVSFQINLDRRGIIQGIGNTLNTLENCYKYLYVDNLMFEIFLKTFRTNNQPYQRQCLELCKFLIECQRYKFTNFKLIVICIWRGNEWILLLYLRGICMHVIFHFAYNENSFFRQFTS